MSFEVEQKFRVNDAAALEARLTERGVTFGTPIAQCDRYFNHPSVDYALTDEALRIRRSGNEVFITYKGPKLDATTKTRRELELPLTADEERWAELLVLLRFRPVAEVRKSRRIGEIAFQGLDFEIALDDVAEVGSFCELEVQATALALDRARESLQSLAAELGLTAVERCSYLELLLARREAPRQK
ncbi:MAG: class IV adenylate cyclase [Planctomycetia bacterium]|nr:class IV adenylate cyclase [Planctomycetia bacterium]